MPSVPDSVPGPTTTINKEHEGDLIKDDDSELMLGIYDISKAQFMPKVKGSSTLKSQRKTRLTRTVTLLDDLTETGTDCQMPQTVGSRIGRNF